MENRLEGVQHLLVLGSAVAGPDGGGASLGDVDQIRRGDDGGGRGGCDVLGPKGGSADVREVDECRRWDYGGGRGAVAAALLSVGSTGVEAGTVAAARAVTRMLTRALATWSMLSSGMADPSAWSASILLCMGGNETFGGWSPCLLSSLRTYQHLPSLRTRSEARVETKCDAVAG
jgi:hypothetical protein